MCDRLILSLRHLAYGCLVLLAAVLPTVFGQANGFNQQFSYFNDFSPAFVPPAAPSYPQVRFNDVSVPRPARQQPLQARALAPTARSLNQSSIALQRVSDALPVNNNNNYAGTGGGLGFAEIQKLAQAGLPNVKKGQQLAMGGIPAQTLEQFPFLNSLNGNNGGVSSRQGGGGAMQNGLFGLGMNAIQQGMGPGMMSMQSPLAIGQNAIMNPINIGAQAYLRPVGMAGQLASSNIGGGLRGGVGGGGIFGRNLDVNPAAGAQQPQQFAQNPAMAAPFQQPQQFQQPLGAVNGMFGQLLPGYQQQQPLLQQQAVVAPAPRLVPASFLTGGSPLPIGGGGVMAGNGGFTPMSMAPGAGSSSLYPSNPMFASGPSLRNMLMGGAGGFGGGASQGLLAPPGQQASMIDLNPQDFVEMQPARPQQQQQPQLQVTRLPERVPAKPVKQVKKEKEAHPAKHIEYTKEKAVVLAEDEKDEPIGLNARRGNVLNDAALIVEMATSTTTTTQAPTTTSTTTTTTTPTPTTSTTTTEIPTTTTQKVVVRNKQAEFNFTQADVLKVLSQLNKIVGTNNQVSSTTAIPAIKIEPVELLKRERRAAPESEANIEPGGLQAIGQLVSLCRRGEDTEFDLSEAEIAKCLQHIRTLFNNTPIVAEDEFHVMTTLTPATTTTTTQRPSTTEAATAASTTTTTEVSTTTPTTTTTAAPTTSTTTSTTRRPSTTTPTTTEAVILTTADIVLVTTEEVVTTRALSAPVLTAAAAPSPIPSTSRAVDQQTQQIHDDNSTTNALLYALLGALLAVTACSVLLTVFMAYKQRKAQERRRELERRQQIMLHSSASSSGDLFDRNRNFNTIRRNGVVNEDDDVNTDTLRTLASNGSMRPMEEIIKF